MVDNGESVAETVALLLCKKMSGNKNDKGPDTTMLKTRES